MGLSWIADQVIFIGVLFGIFFFLIGTMPPQFQMVGYEAQLDYYEQAYPSYWTKEDIEQYTYHCSHNVSSSVWWTVFDFNSGTPSYDFKVHVIFGIINRELFFRHVTWEWGIFFRDRPLWVLEEGEISLSKEEALHFWEPQTNCSRVRPIFAQGARLTCFLTDPNSTRNNLDLAWDEGTVQMELAFGFSDMELAIGGWNLIFAIMTFQAPDINPAINFLIAFPLWVLMIYITTVVVLDILDVIIPL